MNYRQEDDTRINSVCMTCFALLLVIGIGLKTTNNAQAMSKRMPHEQKTMSRAETRDYRARQRQGQKEARSKEKGIVLSKDMSPKELETYRLQQKNSQDSRYEEVKTREIARTKEQGNRKRAKKDVGDNSQKILNVFSLINNKKEQVKKLNGEIALLEIILEEYSKELGTTSELESNPYVADPKTPDMPKDTLLADIAKMKKDIDSAVVEETPSFIDLSTE